MTASSADAEGITAASVGEPFFGRSRTGTHIGENAHRASWRYRTGWRWRRAPPRHGRTCDRSCRWRRHRHGPRTASSTILRGGLPGPLDGAELSGQRRRPCQKATTASAARVIRSAPSDELGFRVGLDCVRVEPEHLGGVRAAIHQPTLRVAHVVLTAFRRVPPRQRVMRPVRRIDDRVVTEDRFHIGAPAPGQDLGQRWQYAEGGVCVAAGARDVLGSVDSTPSVAPGRIPTARAGSARYRAPAGADASSPALRWIGSALRRGRRAWPCGRWWASGRRAPSRASQAPR
jgi:hypothetical protein